MSYIVVIFPYLFTLYTKQFMFSQRLFVCLFVSKITPKVMDDFDKIFEKKLTLEQGTDDSIFSFDGNLYQHLELRIFGMIFNFYY